MQNLQSAGVQPPERLASRHHGASIKDPLTHLGTMVPRGLSESPQLGANYAKWRMLHGLPIENYQSAQKSCQDQQDGLDLTFLSGGRKEEPNF